MWSVIDRQIPRINIPPIPVYIPTAAKAFGNVKIPVPIALFTMLAHDPKSLKKMCQLFKLFQEFLKKINNSFVKVKNGVIIKK